MLFISSFRKTHSLLPFFFFLFSLFFFNCDLLTKQKDPHYIKKIDEEIAWANAAKLTVSVAYPNAWGASPQNGTGRCFDAKRTNERPRKGYPFNLEFTPEADYALTEWRVYASNVLPQGWQFDADPAGFLDSIDVPVKVFPEVDPNGGINSITLDSTGAVTLVPFCIEAPRIVRTFPFMQAGGYYAKNQNIILYFAAPIDGNTALFAQDSITITMRTLDEKMQPKGSVFNIDGLNGPAKYYKNPVWDANRNIIIIEADADKPDAIANAEITVTVGTGIKNLIGNSLTKTVEFPWKTGSFSNVTVEDWEAYYDGDEISITWKLMNENEQAQIPVQLYYFQDSGPRQDAVLEAEENKMHIRNVQPPNADGVRSGQPVTGIHRYDIYLELSGSGDTDNRIKGPLTIWNFPGMKVDQSNTIIIDSVNSGQLTMNSQTSGMVKNFVLMKDIVLESGEWTPVGDSIVPFGGKFYGNGHSITINGNFASSEYTTGLFGYVKDAEIRDLRIVYSAVTAAETSTSCIGGLVGRADGNTTISNTIITGPGKVNITSSSYLYAGAMVGYMASTSQIENCLTEIELHVTGTGNGFIRAGGIAGFIANDSTVSADKLMINKVTVAGIVDARNTDTSNSNTGFIFIGGLAGESQGFGKIEDVKVSATLRMWASNNSTDNRLAYICGGIIGRMKEGHLLDGDFTGTIDIPENYEVLSFTWIGGVVGIAGFVWNNNASIAGNHNERPVTVISSTASGDMYVKVEGPGHISLGGVCAAPYNGNNNLITFEDCEYRDGSIHVERQYTGVSDFDTSIGGFAGQIVTGVNLINCRSRARLVEIISRVDTVDTAQTASIRVGGFIGLTRDSIEGCYSDSPVEVSIINMNNPGRYVALNAGGFVGLFQIGGSWTPNKRISRSYSTGSVTATVYVANPVWVLTPSELCIGGFGGRIQNQVWLEDCYATGNVSLDSKSTSPSGTAINYDKIYAGGFAGSVELTDDNYWLERCFSTGLVSSQGAATTRTNVYAGGFAGNLSSGLIRNCVALGSTVTAKGDSGLAVGRICGNVITGLSGNYASASMLLEEGTYGSYNPSGTTVPGNENDKNGEDIANSSFYSENFWTSASAGPGFNSGAEKPWSFTGIASRGYPALAGIGGQ